MSLSTSISIMMLLSYLMGSIPTGVWISRLFFGFDIRTKGSGNMGSTNIFRVLGKKWGIIVQIIDILKGLLPVILLCNILLKSIIQDQIFFEENILYLQVLAGFCAILGHVFPVFVKFKGGKGINTAAGLLMGIAPVEVSFAILIFLLSFFSSGYISLSSIITSISLPIIVLIRKYLFEFEYPFFNFLLGFFLLLSFLVVFTHRSNIKRLLNGNENKFEKMHLIKFKKNENN